MGPNRTTLPALASDKERLPETSKLTRSLSGIFNPSFTSSPDEEILKQLIGCTPCQFFPADAQALPLVVLNADGTVSADVHGSSTKWSMRRSTPGFHISRWMISQRPQTERDHGHYPLPRKNFSSPRQRDSGVQAGPWKSWDVSRLLSFSLPSL